MITRDITQKPEVLRLYWNTLTAENIEDLIQAGTVKKVMRYSIQMQGEGPRHVGKLVMQAKYQYISEGGALTELGSTPQQEITLPPAMIVDNLLYSLQQFPSIAAQVVAIYGGIPEIVVLPESSPVQP